MSDPHIEASRQARLIAADFLAANPGCSAVSVAHRGAHIRMDRAGHTRVESMVDDYGLVERHDWMSAPGGFR